MVITAAADETTTFTRTKCLDASANDTVEWILAARDQPADWFRECEKKIIKLLELEPNWDSYGAKPINLESIDRARKIVRDLSFVQGIWCPFVAPSPTGDVGLTWEWSDFSRELDVEVGPSRIIHYSYMDENNPDQDCEECKTHDLMVIAQIITKW
jgi:hypothetical protein